MICLPGAEGGGGQRPSLHSVAHRPGTTARLSCIQGRSILPPNPDRAERP